MEISEIKSLLPLQRVLDHYGIEVDRNGRALCPFHDDKTPSLQVYHTTHTWTCFSSNCGAGSGDQIDMIRRKEGCSIHEAILKAQELTGIEQVKKTTMVQEVQISETDRIHLLSRAFNFFSNAIKVTESAKAYMKMRELQPIGNTLYIIEAGYNGARFHYRGKLTDAERQQWIDIGMMKAITGESNTYNSWGKDCIIFPLKNKSGQIVSFYGRSIINDDKQRHYYLKNRQGLYPHYPRPSIKTLILTESIIDAASLIVSGVTNGHTDVLACYGTNGLMQEHIHSMSNLKELEEIIFFFDGDQAGLTAIDKHSLQLSQYHKNVIISKVNTPEGEDINSLHTTHEPGVFGHLLENRIVIKLASDSHKETFSFNGKNNGEEKVSGEPPQITSILNSSDPDHLIYESGDISIHIWGGIERHNLGKLRISLHASTKTDRYKTFRDEVNLYSYAQVARIMRHLSESLGISTTYAGYILADLTQQLETYRLTIKSNKTDDQKPETVRMSDSDRKEAQNLLNSNRLLHKTLELIKQSGLVGQQKNGMLLYLLYLTRYFDEPLHAIIFGKSGSGKTYLQTKISQCLPPEDVRVITSLTENTLYYSPKGFWKHKVLIIEDLEGVYQAFLPLREMMSKQEISKFTTDKDSQGNNVQILLKVEGPICVSGATTQERIYEDNANRSYLLLIDESKDHLDEVMEYQRQEYAGMIDKKSQEKARALLQNAQRLLQKMDVVNPYAQSLILPDKIFKKLRTNMHYLQLIQIITFYNQHNREIKKDETGRRYIETSVDDITWANRLVKESLLQKSDELSGKLRQFFEIVKEMMRATKESERSFYAKQIRQYLRMNPMTVHRHIRELEMRGYIKQIGGNQKIGYEYQIEQWNEYEDLQKGIDIMEENIKKITEKAVKIEV